MAVSTSACGEDVDLNDQVAQDAFITGNVKPDTECAYSPDGAQTQSGLFDIAPGGGELAGGSRTDGCNQPYALHLLVESESGELALFQEAEVTLLSMDDKRLVFHHLADAILPNPFQLTVAGRVDDETGQGIVQVNAIPPQYAEQLESFVDDEIVIAVSLDGRTMGDQPVSTQTFRLPVRLCYGCLTVCSSSIDGDALTADEVTGGECADNAGADGRVCIDPDC